MEEVDDPPDEADDDEPEDPEDGIPRGAVEVEVVDGANDPEDVGEGLLFLPVRIKCQSAVALFSDNMDSTLRLSGSIPVSCCMLPPPLQNFFLILYHEISK